MPVICSNPDCQHENIDGVTFCDQCGQKLELSIQTAKPGQVPAAPSFPSAPAFDQAPAFPPAPSFPPKPDFPTTPAFADSPAFPTNPPPVPTPAAQPDTATSTGSAARLVVERNGRLGFAHQLDRQEMVIGRWDPDSGAFVELDMTDDDTDLKISRRHAKLSRQGDQWFLEDLGSTNGTFVNRGARLVPGNRVPLQDDDEIVMGKTFLRFRQG